VQWLQAQRFDRLAQHLVLQELLLAVSHADERREPIEAAIAELLPQWSLAPVVEALQVLRGINLVTAVTVMAEVGDLRRFESPRQLMGYLGVVPGERSTGESVHRLGISAKAQTRLCARYRALSQRGKKLTVTVTAIARELAGFIRAIGREVQA
jgi:transposase